MKALILRNMSTVQGETWGETPSGPGFQIALMEVHADPARFANALASAEKKLRSGTGALTSDEHAALEIKKQERAAAEAAQHRQAQQAHSKRFATRALKAIADLW